jgi:PAS domain S-box-containing protein
MNSSSIGPPPAPRVAERTAELEMTNEALARKNCRHRVLLRNASDGVHILDADGNVLEASDSFCAMLGCSRDEIIGANVSLRDAQWSPQELKQKIAEQMANEGRPQLATRHRRRDGSIVNAELSGQGLELDGKPVLFDFARELRQFEFEAARKILHDWRSSC